MDHRINPNTSSVYHRNVRVDREAQENNAASQSSLPEADQHRPSAAMVVGHRRPAWVQQVQEGLRQGGDLALGMVNGLGRMARNPAIPKILLGAGAGQIVAFTASVFLSNNAAANRQWQQANAYANMAHLFSQGGKLSILMALGIFIAQAATQRQSHLAGVPLNKVVDKIRAHQSGSSSEVASGFDWSQPRLFVNDQGEDVTPNVSHWLNRIRDAIQNSPQAEASQMWSAANMLLDKLESEPDLRSALANQVKIVDEAGNDHGLNAACIDRTALGFNTLVRELCKDYHADMPAKDFLLQAVHQMVILEADKEISSFMKKNNKTSTPETYQAIHGSAMKALRQQIPDLSQGGIEGSLVSSGTLDIFDVDRFDIGLTKGERNALVKKVVEQFDTPEKIALRLLASKKENAFMEERFSSDLAAIKTEIEERQDEEYAKLDKHPDTPMEAYADVDVRLGKEREELISHLYGSIVAGAGIFKQAA